jgi:NADPH:quinone reductase
VRAVVLRKYGPPEVLVAEDVPEPSPGPGEVVIDVAYANVTFVETQVRAGTPPHPSMLPDLPAVLGNGVGGTVDGRRVVAGLGGTGGYAERAAVAGEKLIDVPEGLELRDAVALMADGRTALGLIRLAQVREGETVLVEAAAGGVGTLLVQLARNAGAHVVALAGGERKLAVARSLGADSAVDYRVAGWERDAGPADVVFDGVGGAVGEATYGLVREGGRFCPFGMASGRFARVGAREGVEVRRGGPPSPESLRELTVAVLDEAAAGRVRPVIGQEVPLEQAAAAHAAIEARETVGKTLLIGGSRGR